MKKRKWTETEAVAWLNKTSDVGFVGKHIFVKSLRGLKACSALDYLVNHNGYTV